jgi:flagellar hook protein FlgE
MNVIEETTLSGYSISLQGVQEARWELERSARRIAGAAVSLPANTGNSADTVDITSAGEAASGTLPFSPVDYAAEAVNISRARTAFKANLKTLSVQAELDQEIVDLLG